MGIATLAGTLDIQLLDGYIPSFGDTFDILSATDITLAGGFLLNQPAELGSFYAWTVADGDGEILRLGFLANSATAPEPSTLVISMLGLASMKTTLGTNRVVTFTPDDLDKATGHIMRQHRKLSGDRQLVAELIQKFPTRKEQIAEWKRLTGKCRRTFEHRMRELDAA